MWLSIQKNILKMYTTSYQTQKSIEKYLQPGSQWQNRFLKQLSCKFHAAETTDGNRKRDKKTHTNNSYQS